MVVAILMLLGLILFLSLLALGLAVLGISPFAPISVLIGAALWWLTIDKMERQKKK